MYHIPHDDRLLTADAALEKNPNYSQMSDDFHLPISVSESCYCVHLIIVMAQLSTKIKKQYFFYYNSISISTARTDAFYGLCSKGKYVGTDQRST